MTASEVDRRIRSLRPPKPRADPFSPHGSLVEDERRPDGNIERALTIFLTGAECPFTCSFCDLWRYTIDGPTPPGALTKQLESVIENLDDPRPDRLKLYNSSNFFDQRAVPLEDLPAIASLSASFASVTVESHASMIGPRTSAFAKQIPGRLEVAVGVETVHPIASAQMNKRLDLGRFESAASYLADNGIDLRVFVILGPPHIPFAESVEWTVRTVEFAVEHGGAVVSIIPVRGGNGELERLQKLGQFSPPTLAQLEKALEACLQFTGTVVTADLWDAGRLPACPDCGDARVARLKRINLTGVIEAPIICDTCDGRDGIM